MSGPPPRNPAGSQRAALALVALALGVRALAAFGVEWAARRRGAVCLFDDAAIYWHLGGAIRTGSPYVVWQYAQPHRALRAPGYPLWLAMLQAGFGPSTLAVRLAQAVLGALGVWILIRLTRRLWPERGGRVALAAGLVAAVEPYSVATSALILSEAVFVPLMLLSLWGLAALWPAPDSPTPRRRGWIALGVGLSAGASVLVRPSWMLYPPIALVGLLAFAGRARRRPALRDAAVLLLGLALAMAPWWARNARVYGRFVPTAIWFGASLYDGLRPDADGSSDMRFLDRPEILRLDETTQDRTLRDAALAFALAHPARVLELAAFKAWRFWCPWPNADQFASPRVKLASALVTLPLYALILVGLASCRRDPRAWVLLIGPALYFMAVHMVFVSSIRYRIPALVPAFALAGAGLSRIVTRSRRKG